MDDDQVVSDSLLRGVCVSVLLNVYKLEGTKRDQGYHSSKSEVDVVSRKVEVGAISSFLRATPRCQLPLCSQPEDLSSSPCGDVCICCVSSSS